MGVLRVIGMAVASSSTLGHLMEAALEAYFRYNSKLINYLILCIRFSLFIYNWLHFKFFFSNGRCSAYVGVSADGPTICGTASAAIRVRAGVRGKIASPLLRVAEKTSILQRYPRGRHASD